VDPLVTVKNANAFQTLRHRDFRLLWFADSISILGTQIQRIAITWHVFQLTNDPFQLGLLGLFRFFPVLVFGLFGGVIADNRDRRLVLIFTHLALMATTGVLATATLVDGASMPLIYTVTFVSSAFNAMAGPARQALIPNLVPRSELAGAATMANLTMQSAMVVGPAIGGVLIAQIGVGAAYVIDTVSFVAVIVAALLIRTRPERVHARERGLAAIRAGFMFLWNTPILLAVMSLDFIATFFGAITTLMPIFAEDILGGGANRLGLLLSAPAAGAVAGSLLFGLLRMPVRPGYGLVACIVAYGACIAGFGLTGNLWLALFFLAGSGAADAISMALRHTLRNLVTPDEYRGRIAAAHSAFAMGGPQLGEFRVGAMASTMGAPASVAIGGIATILSAMAMVRLVPTLLSYRSDARPQATEERTSSPQAV
jgi:MFS family permease